MRIKPQQFTFSGSPEAIMAASNAHQAHMQAQGQVRASQAQAIGQQNSALYQQPANFANAFGGAFGAYTGGLGNAYGAYAGGLGNLATAAANERSNLYGSQAMLGAAQMGALGNIGSAGLGAYGAMGNAAMDAWSRNQQAYNQAASTMQAANQSGISNYGAANASAQGMAAAADAAAQGQAAAARSSALGNVHAARAGAMGQIGAAQATAGGQVGRAQAVANALGGLAGGSGTRGSFSATGVDGPIGYGSFAGLPLGGGGGGVGSPYAPGPLATESSIFGSRDLDFGTDAVGGRSITDPGILSALRENSAAGRRQLDDQHYSSRGMPSEMMGQGLSGLLALTGQSQGAIGAGADQFYKNQRRASDQAMSQFDAIRNGLGSGFDSTRGGMKSGYQNVGNQIQGMWDGSLGLLPQFLTPAKQMQHHRNAQLLQETYRNQDIAAGRSSGGRRGPTMRYL